MQSLGRLEENSPGGGCSGSQAAAGWSWYNQSTGWLGCAGGFLGWVGDPLFEVTLGSEWFCPFRFKNVIFDIIPCEESGRFQVKAKFMGIDMERFQLHYQVGSPVWGGGG